MVILGLCVWMLVCSISIQSNYLQVVWLSILDEKYVLILFRCSYVFVETKFYEWYVKLTKYCNELVLVTSNRSGIMKPTKMFSTTYVSKFILSISVIVPGVLPIPVLEVR